MSDRVEYLLSFGRLGDFGRFRATQPLRCRRGDRAVVVSSRGLEIAEVLRPADAGHALHLPNTSVGKLLRLASAEDEQNQRDLAAKARALFDRGSALRSEAGLPLELLDAEILLDGKHGVLHILRRSECDVRPFVSTLAREFDLHMQLEDLTRSATPTHDEEHSCGSGSCGSGGGCGSCGSGGGCGSCGVAAVPAALQERTPLL